MAKRQPDIRWKTADIKQFNKSLNRLARVSTKQLRFLVGDAAKSGTARAISATPMGPKKTLWVWRPGPLATPVPLKLSSKVPTPGRAYAKSGWSAAARALRVKNSGKFGRSHGKSAFVDRRRRHEKPTFRVINRVPYIKSLDTGGPVPALPNPAHSGAVAGKNIVKKAIFKATRSVERRIAGITKRKIKAAWR